MTSMHETTQGRVRAISSTLEWNVVLSRRWMSECWYRSSRWQVPRLPFRAETESDRRRCQGNTTRDRRLGHLAVGSNFCVLWRTQELIQGVEAPRMRNDVRSRSSKMSWFILSTYPEIQGASLGLFPQPKAHRIQISKQRSPSNYYICNPITILVASCASRGNERAAYELVFRQPFTWKTCLI